MAFTIQVGQPQIDGRVYVLEVYTDGQGEWARFEYLADPGANHTAIAAAREPMLLASLAEQEARDTVDRRLPPNPRFQTEDQLLVLVRQRYLRSVGVETCQIARWIVDQLDAATVTTAQMRTAFGVSAGAWNAINGRMDTYRAAINSVETAVGE